MRQKNTKVINTAELTPSSHLVVTWRGDGSTYNQLVLMKDHAACRFGYDTNVTGKTFWLKLGDCDWFLIARVNWRSLGRSDNLGRIWRIGSNICMLEAASHNLMLSRNVLKRSSLGELGYRIKPCFKYTTNHGIYPVISSKMISVMPGLALCTFLLRHFESSFILP